MHSLRHASLSTLLIVLFSAAAGAASDYLIITTDDLAPAFQDLANQKALQGYSTELMTVESIQQSGTPGRDLPEQIRNAIKNVYAAGSLRFVLLGGDTALIPARMAQSDFYPSDPFIPTDLYYAALDGDWDSDGDDVFAEFLVDAADLNPEVSVGRAPVTSASQAAQYVGKVAQYESPTNTQHLQSALLLDEVLFPTNWNPGETISLDGALFGEEIASIVQSGPTPLTDERLYENHFDFPGSSPLSKAQALAALDSGNHGLVVHGGHGYVNSMSLADDNLLPADALGLRNGPHHFVLLSQISRGAALDDDAILEDFLRNHNGGAIAAIGMSRASFPLTTQGYFRDLHEEIFLSASQHLGEALKAVQSARSVAAQSNSAERHALFSLNLLGDPEVGVGLSATATAAATAAPIASAAGILLRSVVPNPFNPSVTIHFELSGPAQHALMTTISIYDAAGRKVRTLWDGPMLTGPQQLSWNGLDDSGIALSSGAYFAAIESGGQRRSAKMTLLK